MKKPEQFIVDWGGPYLDVLIDGKYVRVKCGTVGQMERYGKMIDANAKKAIDKLKSMETAKAEKPDEQKLPHVHEFISDSLEQLLDMALIILNPLEDDVKFSRETIANELTYVSLGLLRSAWVWKIENISEKPNPRFAPPEPVKSPEAKA